MQPQKKKFKLIFIGIATIVFAYVALRAYLLSFTYDECSSYLLIHDKAFKELFETANNHLLNSFFIWIISSRLGNSEFLLRLPNVIAFTIYIVYLYRILSILNSFPVKLFGAAFLLLNPYVLDFFSLARGYGLSMAFCLASIYYFIQSFNTSNTIDIGAKRFKSIAFASLAVLSNLVLLNYTAAVVSSFILMDIFSKKISFKNLFQQLKSGFPSIFLLLILMLIVFPVVAILTAKKALFHGGKNFFTDTIGSLIDHSLYEQYPVTFLKMAMLIFTVAVFLLLAYVVFRHMVRNKKVELNEAVFLLVFLSALFPFMLKIFFGTLLPLDRTALFYILLYGVFMVFVMDSTAGVKSKRLVNIFSGLCVVVVTLHFINAANLRYVLNWKYDATTKDAVEEMRKIAEKHTQLSIGADWSFEPSLTYYRVKNDYPWLFPHVLNCPWCSEEENTNAQKNVYSIYYLGRDRNLGEVFSRQELKEIKRYELTEAVLYENKITEAEKE